MSGVKKCTTCGQAKGVGEFARDKSKKDGFHPRCKACRAQYRRDNRKRIAEQKAEYYAANRERIAERNAEFYAANRDRERGRAAKWRAENRERARENAAKWRTENRERVAEQQAEYRAANRDRIAERNAEYYAANRDRIVEQNAEYYAANRDRIVEQKAEYHADRWANDPEYRAQHYARAAARRARERGLPADGSGPSDWLSRMEDDDTWNCHLCGGGFEAADATHWDHRDPISTGTAGTVLANMSLAHAPCNISRGNTPLTEWAERVGLPDGIV